MSLVNHAAAAPPSRWHCGSLLGLFGLLVVLGMVATGDARSAEAAFAERTYSAAEVLMEDARTYETPVNNAVNANWGGTTTLSVLSNVSGEDIWRGRSYLRFSPERLGLHYSAIRKVELILTPLSAASGATVLEARRVLAGWEEGDAVNQPGQPAPNAGGTLSWSNQPPVAAAAVDRARLEIPVSGEPVRLDITGVVKAWLSGTVPNHGLALVGQDEEYGRYYFNFYSSESPAAALRPKVAVTFDGPVWTGLFTDSRSYTDGDRLRLGLAVENPTGAAAVDAYFALQGPQGLRFFPRWVNVVAPALPDHALGAGEVIPPELLYDLPLPAARPPVEVSGRYQFLALLTRTGTFEPMGSLAAAPFHFHNPVDEGGWQPLAATTVDADGLVLDSDSLTVTFLPGAVSESVSARISRRSGDSIARAYGLAPLGDEHRLYVGAPLEGPVHLAMPAPPGALNPALLVHERVRVSGAGGEPGTDDVFHVLRPENRAVYRDNGVVAARLEPGRAADGAGVPEVISVDVVAVDLAGAISVRDVPAAPGGDEPYFRIRYRANVPGSAVDDLAISLQRAYSVLSHADVMAGPLGVMNGLRQGPVVIDLATPPRDGLSETATSQLGKDFFTIRVASDAEFARINRLAALLTHELTHVVQAYREPESAPALARRDSPYLWLKEATAGAAQWIYGMAAKAGGGAPDMNQWRAEDPACCAPDPVAANPTFINAALETDTAAHGYGAAALVLHNVLSVVPSQSVGSVWQDIAAARPRCAAEALSSGRGGLGAFTRDFVAGPVRAGVQWGYAPPFAARRRVDADAGTVVVGGELAGLSARAFWYDLDIPAGKAVDITSSMGSASGTYYYFAQKAQPADPWDFVFGTPELNRTITGPARLRVALMVENRATDNVCEPTLDTLPFGITVRVRGGG